MERIKPMLGDVELQQVQQLNIDADQVLTRARQELDPTLWGVVVKLG